MFRRFWAGGRAAALLTLAAFFAAPSTAAQAQSAADTTATAPAAAQQPLSLHDLVISFVDFHNQDDEQLCLAKAVYFESRGEKLEGQLAVAEVVLNRVASPEYPDTICGVVTQPA